jgi:hypothetical protein
MKTVIFKLLDILNYNRLEIGDRIYFVKKIGDEYSEIRFDKSDGFCWISYDLISFLSSITGFERTEVQKLIGKWVEHTLQMKVKYNTFAKQVFKKQLNIPYN